VAALTWHPDRALPVAQVDPADHALMRFVVRRYRYDLERRQRRHVVEVAFDEAVFKASRTGRPST
jgi:hypothetical protein